jgi:hypothetical protein
MDKEEMLLYRLTMTMIRRNERRVRNDDVVIVVVDLIIPFCWHETEGVGVNKQNFQWWNLALFRDLMQWGLSEEGNQCRVVGLQR